MLVRPGFKAGTPFQTNNKKASLNPLNKRIGSNWEIRRPGARSDAKAGVVVDFDLRRALKEEREGVKIQLSDEALKKLFDVEVPDPTDKAWLDERDARIASLQTSGLSPAEIEEELRVNKPLGREQRKSSQKQNIATTTLLTITDKLKEIKDEVDRGQILSTQQQAGLLGQLAFILQDTNAIAALSQQGTQYLQSVLTRVGLPVDRAALGLVPRFIDYAFYAANAGMINLLLFNRVLAAGPQPGVYDFEFIVKNLVPSSRGQALRLATAVGYMRGGVNPMNKKATLRYMDLDDSGVINRAQILDALSKTPGGLASPDFALSVAP